MAEESQDYDSLVADRKRSLEDDDSVLKVTDTSQILQNSKAEDQPQPNETTAEDLLESNPDRKSVKRTKTNNSQKKGPSGTLSLRLLIPTNYSGLLIGKAGSTISAIKESSGAKVTVSEMVPAAPDRILTATGAPEEISSAISEVARILVRAENQQYKTNESEFKRLTMRFLIPHEIMGAIIGKKAVKVKEIQKMTNCRISAEQGLLLDSTERKMNVIGDADSIRSAVLLISQIILDFPASVAANIPYIPKPYLESNPMIPVKVTPYVNPQISYGQSPNFNSYLPPAFNGVHSGFPPPFYTDNQEYSQSPYIPQQLINPSYSLSSLNLNTGQPYDHSLSSIPFANVNVESFQSITSYPSQLVNVPKQFVGVLIGKAGRNINEMRRVSRCDIEMLDLDPDIPPGQILERQFKISGPPQQIAVAVDMIGARLDAERRRIAKYGA